MADEAYYLVSPDLYRASMLFALIHLISMPAPLHPTLHKMIYFNTLGIWCYTIADALYRTYRHFFPPSPNPLLPIGPRLARQNINKLTPYRCARDDYSSGILLDANENSLGPPHSTSVTNPVSPTLERYPSPTQDVLKSLFCSHRNATSSPAPSTPLTPSNLFVGNGSDEAIDLVIRCFCGPKDSNGGILITPPTYGMYKVLAVTNEVRIISAPLFKDFSLDTASIIKCRNYVNVIFVCSPGNPTARAIPNSEVSKIASRCKNNLIVVDEAYVDFSDHSAVSLINAHPNVVVLQTMSKAFGLAGIRCGFAIGDPSVIQILNNVKAPYNVNKLTSAVACSALSPSALSTLKKNIETLKVEKARVIAELNKMTTIVSKVHPSDSNFLLFKLTSHAKEIYKFMAEEGVVTRYRGDNTHCEECNRVTIGSRKENDAFLKGLKNAHNAVVVASKKKQQ